MAVGLVYVEFSVDGERLDEEDGLETSCVSNSLTLLCNVVTFVAKFSLSVSGLLELVVRLLLM